MNNAKKRNLISLILNIAMFVLVAYAIAWFFTPEGLKSGAGNMRAGGIYCLRFFTNLSNILAALSSIVLVPFNIRAIKSGKDEIPGWAMVLKFVGTVAVTLTLLVVLVFLGPLMGYAAMFKDSCLELHLICPLIAIISFCCFEKEPAITKRQLWWGVLPTVIYGTVYLVNVIFIKRWTDFYGFNIGGRWYISYVALPAVTYLIALAISKLHNRRN